MSASRPPKGPTNWIFMPQNPFLPEQRASAPSRSPALVLEFVQVDMERARRRDMSLVMAIRIIASCVIDNRS